MTMRNINLDMELSPEILKIGIVISAIFLAWITNGYLKEATVKIGSQTIYGEQAAPSLALTTANAQKLVALSIVQSSTINDQTASVSNDQLIEDAFKIPAPIVEVKDIEQKKVTNPVMDLITRYRPKVNGTTNNGAFINGHFYAVLEPMLAMPVLSTTGQVLNPRISRISSSSVTLDLGGAQLSLPFISY